MKADVEAGHEAVLALWDEEFRGWPSRLPNSSGKDGGAAYLAEYFPEPTQMSPRLERQGIRLAGDVAILVYRLRWGGTDAGGSVTAATTRLTHTWIERDSGWRIRGGMDWSEHAADQGCGRGVTQIARAT